MASTVEETVYLHESAIQEYHVYKAVWNPVLGEVHCLALEEGNKHDHFAICVKRGDEIIDHVPRELSGEVWHLLRHGGRSSCEIIGRRKQENGLEVLCRYCFVAKRQLIKKLEVCFKTKSPHRNSSLIS